MSVNRPTGWIRRRHLIALHKLQDGLCAVCLRKTGLAFRLFPDGWVIDSLGLNLYSPDQQTVLPAASLDHIIRVREGGSNDIENLRMLCVECNQERN